MYRRPHEPLETADYSVELAGPLKKLATSNEQKHTINALDHAPNYEQNDTLDFLAY